MPTPINLTDIAADRLPARLRREEFVSITEKRNAIKYLEEIANQMPDGDEKTKFLNDLRSGPPESFFGTDNKLKNDKAELLSADLMSALGGQAVIVDDVGVPGRKVVVFGRDGGATGPDPRGPERNFTPTAILPLEDFLVPGEPGAAADSKFLSNMKLNPGAGRTYADRDELVEQAKFLNANADTLATRIATAAPPRPAPPAPSAPGASPSAGGARIPAEPEADTKGYIEQLLNFTANSEDKRNAAIAKLRQMAESMPSGTEKDQLTAALNKPGELFDVAGHLKDAPKNTIKNALQSSFSAVAIDKGGKRVIALGQFEPSSASAPPGAAADGKFKVAALIDRDELGKAEAMDKLKVPATPQSVDATRTTGGLEVDTSQIGSMDDETLAPAADLGRMRRLSPRKNMLEKMMNPSSMIGMIIAVLAGGYFGGIGGMLIGLIAGPLIGNFMSGNNPFSDTERTAITPGTPRIQVRTAEGEAPTMEMALRTGDPKTRVYLKGKAEGDKFVITERVIQTRGRPPERESWSAEVKIDSEGGINTNELYAALKVPPATAPASGAGRAGAGAAPGATLGAPETSPVPEIDNITFTAKRYSPSSNTIILDAVATARDGSRRTYEVEVKPTINSTDPAGARGGRPRPSRGRRGPAGAPLGAEDTLTILQITDTTNGNRVSRVPNPVAFRSGSLRGATPETIAEVLNGMNGERDFMKEFSDTTLNPKLVDAVNKYARLRFSNFKDGTVNNEKREEFVRRYLNMVQNSGISPDEQLRRANDINDKITQIQAHLTNARAEAEGRPADEQKPGARENAAGWATMKSEIVEALKIMQKTDHDIVIADPAARVPEKAELNKLLHSDVDSADLPKSQPTPHGVINAADRNR